MAEKYWVCTTDDPKHKTEIIRYHTNPAQILNDLNASGPKMKTKGYTCYGPYTEEQSTRKFREIEEI